MRPDFLPVSLETHDAFQEFVNEFKHRLEARLAAKPSLRWDPDFQEDAELATRGVAKVGDLGARIMFLTADAAGELEPESFGESEEPDSDQ